jgi:hypothetical protein
MLQDVLCEQSLTFCLRKFFNQKQYVVTFGSMKIWGYNVKIRWEGKKIKLAREGGEVIDVGVWMKISSAILINS